jgi:hypothetical protein
MGWGGGRTEARRWWLTPVILAEIGKISVLGQPKKLLWETTPPSSKITKGKWTGCVAQAVACLLCKYEALSSNPSPTKKKRERESRDEIRGRHLWLTPVILAGEYLPAWANISTRPYLKKPFTKKDWWSGSRCRPWIQAPVQQKKKKKKRRKERNEMRTGSLNTLTSYCTQIWSHLVHPPSQGSQRRPSLS